VRSPSKSALLAHVAGAVGRGRGFGLHKALDQLGAFLGPVVVAALVAATGAIWPGMLVLVVPGAAAIAVLLVIRARVPDPSVYDASATAADAQTAPSPPAEASKRESAVSGVSAVTAPGGIRGWVGDAVGVGLPATFFSYAVAASLVTGGLVTFGIISYHLTVAGLVPVAAVPLVYAGAMAVEAVAALAVGALYDRMGGSVLYAVPVLVAAVPALAFTGTPLVALVGVAVWGLAYGVQDSTVKALVADLVAPARRATAYGVFAGIQGALAVVGGVVAGWLYERSLPALVVVIAVSQLVALALLVRTVRSIRRAA
jgi:MFS family permease